jgi:hypothetical protein
MLDGRLPLLDTVLREAQQVEQRLDQRRAFLGWDVRKFQLHPEECRKTRPDQVR